MKTTIHSLDQRYVILSQLGTSTETSIYIYPRFDVIYDTNHNLIHDPWELPLAEKFCPRFKLHSVTDWIAPEPVEYINADVTSGLWFALIVKSSGQSVDDYPVTDDALFSPPVSNWNPWINNPNTSWETLTWNPFDYTGQPPGKAYTQYLLRFHFSFNGNDDPSS